MSKLLKGCHGLLTCTSIFSDLKPWHTWVLNIVPCQEISGMEQGWDPEVKKYFKKILNTIGIGLLWLMMVLTAGLYFRMAYHGNLISTILFYAAVVITLFFLIRYYYRTWK